MRVCREDGWREFFSDGIVYKADLLSGLWKFPGFVSCDHPAPGLSAGDVRGIDAVVEILLPGATGSSPNAGTAGVSDWLAYIRPKDLPLTGALIFFTIPGDVGIPAAAFRNQTGDGFTIL